MAVPQVRKTGPRTYKAGAPIRGGQVVVGTDNSTVIPSQDASARVLGVAVTDAVATNAPSTIDAFGNPVANAVAYPTDVAVADSGIEVPATYAAAAQFGDLLVGAANGQVTPAGADPDVRTVVGRCTEPGGVTAAGRTGLVRTV